MEARSGATWTSPRLTDFTKERPRRDAGAQMLNSCRFSALARSPAAEAQRPGRTLRQPVVLPGVRGGLDLRHDLPCRLVHVVQTAGGAGRIRVIKRTGLVGVVELIGRPL